MAVICFPCIWFHTESLLLCASRPCLLSFWSLPALSLLHIVPPDVYFETATPHPSFRLPLKLCEEDVEHVGGFVFLSPVISLLHKYLSVCLCLCLCLVLSCYFYHSLSILFFWSPLSLLCPLLCLSLSVSVSLSLSLSLSFSILIQLSAVLMKAWLMLVGVGWEMEAVIYFPVFWGASLGQTHLDHRPNHESV